MVLLLPVPSSVRTLSTVTAYPRALRRCAAADTISKFTPDLDKIFLLMYHIMYYVMLHLKSTF